MQQDLPKGSVSSTSHAAGPHKLQICTLNKTIGHAMFGAEDAGNDYIFGVTVMSTFSADLRLAIRTGTMGGIAFQAVSEQIWDDRREIWSMTAAEDNCNRA
jgi:hypothetical protein